MRSALVCLIVLVSGCAAQRGAASASAPDPAPAPAAAPAAAPAPDAAAARKLEARLHAARRLNEQALHADAERILAEALPRSRALKPRQPLLEAAIASERASSLISLHRTAEARALIAEAQPLLRPGELSSDRRAFVLSMISAESHRYDRKPALAIEPFERAVAIAERHADELTSELVDALDRLATTLLELGRTDEAERARSRSYAITRSTHNLTGRARLLQLAFERAGAGNDTPLWEQSGAFARLLTRYATEPSDAPVTPEAPAVSAPKAVSDSSGQASGSLGVSNAAQEVAAMRADFRQCYQSALAVDPTLSGRARLSLKIGPGGEVTEAQAVAVGLSVAAVDCLLQRAIAGRFAPPDGGSARIVVPVTFIRQ